MALFEPSEEEENEPLCLAPSQWDLNVKTGIINIKENKLKSFLKSHPLENIYTLSPQPIARGQFAVVYHCTNRITGKEYAAKFSSLTRLGEDCLGDIIHEIAVSAILKHCARTINLSDVFKTDKEMVLLMEYAPGGDLQTLLDEDIIPYEKDVLKFMRQLLEGLIYIHDKNIVHLDIKPQNLVLMGDFPDCGLKLCDFEISRMVTGEHEVREVLGTPDYVAPEILLYEPITTQTDMWSVGVLAYVLLTGFLPFGGENDQETFMEILKCEVDFPSELFEDITPEAIDFIKKLLIRKPEQRMSARESLNHAWMKGGVSQLNTPLTLEEKPLTSSKEPSIPSIIVNDTNSIGGISTSCASSNSYTLYSQAVSNSTPHISAKPKSGFGRPPLHPISSQKSSLNDNTSSIETPVNTPSSNKFSPFVYHLDSKFGSRHNLERIRSMSKSRDVISERVQLSNLKKCLSKSRERLCEARFGNSKSREQLMALNSFSQSVEALSYFTQQNLFQSCNNISLAPKFKSPQNNPNSQDRKYQSMAAIDQIDNMDYSKSVGFFESSVSLTNPSYADISVHRNGGQNCLLNVAQLERSPEIRCHFGLRGNTCRGGRTGTTDACDSRYTKHKQAEGKLTQRIPKISKTEKMKKDAQKRRKERKEKEKQERLRKEREAKLLQKDRLSISESETKSETSEIPATPPFRRASVSHVEQRLQERHERNLERKEKLLREEKQNRKTSLDSYKSSSRCNNNKVRTKSTSSIPCSKERTRSLTPTNRLSKKEAHLGSNVSQASSLESVTLIERSSSSDISEKIWYSKISKLKKSDKNNYKFKEDESNESDEAYASLEEVPREASFDKNIDNNSEIETSKPIFNRKAGVISATSFLEDSTTDHLSVSDRIYSFEKGINGGFKRNRQKIGLVIPNHCNCETKELPVITEEASPISLHSSPHFRRSASNASDFGSFSSESSEVSTFGKDSFSITSESSSEELSPDWKKRSKSFSVYHNPAPNEASAKTRSNSFNLEMLSTDLARPWGNVCSGSVARAFKKFNIDPNETVRTSPSNTKFQSNFPMIRSS